MKIEAKYYEHLNKTTVETTVDITGSNYIRFLIDDNNFFDVKLTKDNKLDIRGIKSIKIALSGGDNHFYAELNDE
jgi:hypothetical protein